MADPGHSEDAGGRLFRERHRPNSTLKFSRRWPYELVVALCAHQFFMIASRFCTLLPDILSAL